MGKILVVDDDTAVRQVLSALLVRHGCEASTASSGKEALQSLNDSSFDVVITDLKMEDMSGLDLLRKIKANSPEVEVILLTAFGTISNAVEVMRAEAFDYVTKPFNNEELLIVVDRALEKRKLMSEVKYLREALDYKYNFGTVIGQSPLMRKLVNVIAKVAPKDVPVLIRGDSGTGKKLVAKTIHDNSSRKNERFVEVDCSDIPEDFLESELFGNPDRSASRAGTRKIGLFEEARRGTIFLNDVSDISQTLQAKIMRALESGDGARIIAASKINLANAVSNHKFRQDLYTKLNGVSIIIPRLCERGDDILLLAEHFLKKYAREFGKKSMALTSDAAKVLLGYSWPGNVQELENTIKRTVALTDRENIRVKDLIMVANVTEGRHHLKFKMKSDKQMSLEAKELEYIVSSLRENSWNYTRTAKQLGIGRTTLWRKMKKIKEHENS